MERITVQVLNGATGEYREVVAKVDTKDTQEAVNKLFSSARRDDYYYRFLSRDGVIAPTLQGGVPLTYQDQTYWAYEV
jgi:hypothetical protein